MTEKEWKLLCADTTERMSEHVQQFTTPISKVVSSEYGKHHGSGSYYENNGKKFIISNEHVLRIMTNTTLTHKFYDNDNIYKLINPPKLIKEPIDIGISKVDEDIWNKHPHNASALPINRFALKHEPETHELLFIAGYSGERSNFAFNTLSTPGTPYATQETDFPLNVGGADQKYHFALFYLPEKVESVSANAKPYLPDPHGLSGTLVWDTKLVKCLNEGRTWQPEYAVVTGILWGWPSSDGCVLATKIEHFRDQLLIYND